MGRWGPSLAFMAWKRVPVWASLEDESLLHAYTHVLHFILLHFSTFSGSQSWTLYTGPLRATSHTLHFTLCTYLDHFPSHTSCLAHRRGGGIHGQWQLVAEYLCLEVLTTPLRCNTDTVLSQAKQKCQHLVHVQYLIHRLFCCISGRSRFLLVV